MPIICNLFAHCYISGDKDAFKIGYSVQISRQQSKVFAFQTGVERIEDLKPATKLPMVIARHEDLPFLMKWSGR